MATYNASQIVTLTETFEGRKTLRDNKLKPAMTPERAHLANYGKALYKDPAMEMEMAMTEQGIKTPTTKKTEKSTTTKGKDTVKTTTKPKAKTTKAPAKAAAKPKVIVPAGFRMLMTAMEGGYNVTDTLLVGAYVDVLATLRDADVPITSVKGVYVEGENTFAHLNVSGKDGSETMTDAKLRAAYKKVLGASSVRVHTGARTAEGSHAKNFIAENIGVVDINKYEMLSTDEVSAILNAS